MQPNGDTLDTVQARVEAAFAAIGRERMAGLPIVNPALSVAAVGTQAWGGNWIAILVTPWCMNILMLPAQADAWSALTLGATIRHVLPSGEFSFILGDEPALGRFQMCSLFSPMLEFSDQAAALATAEAALAELMTPAAKQVAPAHAVSRRNLFGLRGEEANP